MSEKQLHNVPIMEIPVNKELDAKVDKYFGSIQQKKIKLIKATVIEDIIHDLNKLSGEYMETSRESNTSNREFYYMGCSSGLSEAITILTDKLKEIK